MPKKTAPTISACLDSNTKETIMEQENKGQTIYFKDLFFAILYQWKWLVIVALVGAILLGGIQMLGSNQQASLDSVSITPETQMKVDLLEATEQRLTVNIEAQTQYLENSVLMSIDPYTAISSGIYLRVSPEGITDPEVYNHQMAAILRGYYTQLLMPETLTQLDQTMEMEAIYLRELISLDFSNESYLGITARGRDQQEAEKLRDSICQVIEASQNAMAQDLGVHTVTMIPFTVGPRVDNSLYDTQNSAHQKLTTMTNTLFSTTSELKRLMPQGLSTGGMSPVLFAAIGGVLGFIVVAAIAFVMHLASGKVYSARVLQDRTDLKVLGCLPGKKRNAIDRWLRKLEGRTQADAAEAVATNIANRSKDIQQLLLLGTYEDTFLQPLVKALESRGKVCTVCADPAQSAEAMDAIDQCQVAILVESCGISGYENVIWEKNTIEEYGKQLLGCVVIDG